jgi:hypothetical protein
MITGYISNLTLGKGSKRKTTKKSKKVWVITSYVKT